jgi:very-short-patch-repair endonuclease
MGKKLTQEEFITRAKEIHKDDNGNFKYDYSLVEYKNNHTKIIIKCKEHGNFEQIPKDHIKGRGCNKCGKTKKLTQYEFIEKSNQIHNNKFDYKNVIYKNNLTKVKIICQIHGEFEQKPLNHLSGHGCAQCGNERNAKLKLNDEKIYIEKLSEIHNSKYDYSKVVYNDSHIKVTITCPIHGDFEQMPYSHFQGKGCPKCGGTKKLTKEEFVKKSNEIHKSKYNYDNIIYKNNITKISIKCSIHGFFKQKPNSHLNGSGCSKCKFSKGEKKVENFLINNKIIYFTQKKFKDCKNIRKLPFDFYLPKQNILIEYDGAQHFYPLRYNNNGIKKLAELQIRDKIKTDYAKNNNIKLIRIPYTNFKKIEKILENELFR